MKIEESRPHVGRVSKIVVNSDGGSRELASDDYCMLYVVSGSAAAESRGIRYNMQKGCILVCEPGERVLLLCAKNSAEFIVINFDYISDHKENYEPRAVVRREFSDEETFNGTVYLSGMQFLEESFFDITIEYKRRDKYFEIRMSGEMSLIIVEIARKVAYTKGDTVRDKINDILVYIHDHCGEKITNKSIGEHFNFDPRYINKLVKKRTGYSLHRYVLMRRISKAIYLLHSTDLLVSEIIEAVGFCRPCYFFKYFRQVMDMSPREYRRRVNTK